MNPDERVTRLLELHDPARDYQAPPIDLAALRARAAAGDYRRPTLLRRVRVRLFLMWNRRPSGRSVRRTAVVVAIIGTLLAVFSPGATAKPTTPALNKAFLSRIDDPGSAVLLRLIASLSPIGVAPVRPVTYLRQQEWAVDTTAPTYAEAAKVIAHDVQTWRTPDQAGRLCRVVLPSQPAGTERAERTAAVDAPAPCGDRETPNTLNVPFSYPDGEPVISPAVDTDQLTAQFASDQPIRQGDQFLLRAVVHAFQYYALMPVQRAAALSVLATAATLRYRGPTVDRAGRPGQAFTVTSGPGEGQTTDLIVIDPVTGRILDHEEIALTAGSRSLTRVPAVVSYTLLLAATTVEAVP